MRLFDREMVVGGGGADNRNKPTIDYLMTFTDYTVLVEIKRPDTPIFLPRKSGRAGRWRFSADFVEAISQILEQKAEWLAAAQLGENFDKSGSRRLETRTRDAKVILVIGNRAEFDRSENLRDATIKRDTFELSRRDTRGVEIVTFDELLTVQNSSSRDRQIVIPGYFPRTRLTGLKTAQCGTAEWLLLTLSGHSECPHLILAGI